MAENDDLAINVTSTLENNLVPEISPIPELPDIVVPEPNYQWPSAIPKEKIGDFSRRSTLLKTSIKAIEKLYPAFDWIPVVKSKNQVRNPIADLPEIVAPLEALFCDELQAEYSDAQRALLNEADCVLIGVNRQTNSIMAYCSARYAAKNTVKDVSSQITAGGHLVVASEHHDNDLGPFLASAASIYGYSLFSFFAQSIVVLRSNNRYIEKVLRRAEPIYRSDCLNGDETEHPLDQIRAAIKWVHEDVFHLTGTPFGAPLAIDHRFDQGITMDGLRENQIIYLARRSSMFYFLYRVFLKVAQRKIKRKP